MVCLSLWFLMMSKETVGLDDHVGRVHRVLGTFASQVAGRQLGTRTAGISSGTVARLSCT